MRNATATPHRSRLETICTLVLTVQIIAWGSSAAVAQRGDADAALIEALAPELTNATWAGSKSVTDRQRNSLAISGSAFRLQGDFNSDGREDLLLLGQHGADRTRSFVLIATANPGGWIRSGLLTFERDFVTVQRSKDSRVSLLFCVSCDDGGQLEWIGSEYVLRPFPPAGVR